MTRSFLSPVSVAGTLTATDVLTVPQISAGGSTGTSGQFLKSTGTGLQWATISGTGTVTSVATGTGLTGGTITTSGTLAIDTTIVPQLAGTNTFTNTNVFSGTVKLGIVASNAGSATRLELNSAYYSLGVYAANTNYVALAVKPFSSGQTSDLQQLQNSAGTVLGGRNALAQIYTGSTSPILVATGGATTAATGDGTTATITTTSAHGLAVGDLVTVAGVTPTGYNATALITAVGTTTTFSYLNATSGAQTVAGTVSAPAQSSVTARSAGTRGLIVQGAASQTANLQEWQNSAGTAVASVSSAGVVTGQSFIPTSSTVPTNGIYLPAANTVGIATNSTVHFQIDSVGNIGIGTISNPGYGIWSNRNWTGATSIWGMHTRGAIQSDVTANFIAYDTLMSTQAASFTLSSLTHYNASQGTIGAGSTLTNQYGFQVQSTLTGATNNYGFYSNIPSGTNRYNLYMAGTAGNFIQGKLLLGNSGATSVNFSTAGDITGGTAWSQVQARGTIQTDVTNTAYIVRTAPATVASAFTVANVIHYSTAGTTIGAGSAITTQIGYAVEATMTGATNTWGFRGQLTSATNTYNLYMDGTAANYLAGQTTIGSTSLTLGGGGVAQQFGVVSQAATTVGAVIQGAASQTADLQEWQNSGATVLSGVNAAGQIYAGSTTAGISTATVTLTSAAYTSATVAVFTYAGTSIIQLGQTVTVAGVTGGTYNGTWVVTAVTATTFTVIGSGFTNVAGSGGTVQLSATASFTANTSAITPVLIIGAASQTADLFRVQNSAGTILSRVTSSGSYLTIARISAGSTTTAIANINSYISSPSLIGIIVQGAASQTADLQEWQNSAGTVLSGFNAAGQIYAGTTASKVGSTTTALTSAAYTSATVAVFTYGGTSLVQVGQTVTVAGVTGGTYNGTWVVSAVTSTTFTVLGSGFTNVAGSGGTVQLSAVASFVAGTAAITPLIVQGAASQTANLQEWQNSANGVLARINQNGNIGTAASFGSTTAGLTILTPNFDTSGMGIVIQNAAHKGLIVQGAASQTANLQEWQNNSGIILSAVDTAGNFTKGDGDQLVLAAQIFG